jgi:type II secretory ATPase GspE/PulE/Tfp pilus assembly ATPase PilB-like protein
VLSSIDADHTPQAVGRLLGMGVDPFHLAIGLEGLIEQRVVRRICPACKQSVEPSKAARGWLGLKSGQKLAEGRGCDECHGTGFKGWIGLYAVMPATEELRDLLLTRPQPNILRQFFVKAQRTAMVPVGMEKVKSGLTTFAEVMRMGGFMLDPAAAGV